MTKKMTWNEKVEFMELCNEYDDLSEDSRIKFTFEEFLKKKNKEKFLEFLKGDQC